MLQRSLATISDARTKRISSWDKSGRNADRWSFQPGESKVLADVDGPG